jgi:hypothetical protein
MKQVEAAVGRTGGNPARIGGSAGKGSGRFNPRGRRAAGAPSSPFQATEADGSERKDVINTVRRALAGPRPRRGAWHRPVCPSRLRLRREGIGRVIGKGLAGDARSGTA